MTEEALRKAHSLLESISLFPTTWQQLPQDTEAACAVTREMIQSNILKCLSIIASN